MDPNYIAAIIAGVVSPIIIEGLHRGHLTGWVARGFVLVISLVIAGVVLAATGGIDVTHLTARFFVDAGIVLVLGQAIFNRFEKQISMPGPQAPAAAADTGALLLAAIRAAGVRADPASVYPPPPIGSR